MPTSTQLIQLPSDFLAQVFGVASSVLAGGTWILIALALGVMLAVFFAGKTITWIKKGLSRGRRR